MTKPHVEIEAKLAIVSQDAADVAGEIARLESLGDLLFRSAESVTVHDLYYDTPGLQLEQRGIALRLRSSQSRRLLALKGPEINVGSTIQREELEQDLSGAALLELQQELGERGVRVGSVAEPLTDSNANDLLLRMGLIETQNRHTHRKQRRVVSKTKPNTSLAEFSIDHVVFSVGVRGLHHHEVEIELESDNDVMVVEDLVRRLQQRWSSLTLWHHSKYATGKALEALLKGGELAAVSGDAGDLLPAAYRQMELWLGQQS